MIILNQEGNCICPMSALRSIECKWYDLQEGKKIWRVIGYYAVVNKQPSCGRVLGEYQTEERAKEVLGEITVKYGAYITVEGGSLLTTPSYVQPILFEPPKVYKMPAE